MRKIKAIFEVSHDSNLCGVVFRTGSKKIYWEELTRMEQIHMLNSWVNFHALFGRYVKQEGEK